MRVAAIVPSAGKGARLKSRIQKPYIKLIDKPILAHTLIRLSKNKRIKEIILAVAKEKAAHAGKMIDRYGIKNVKLVIGGRERRDSVYNALKAVSHDIDYILIHKYLVEFMMKNLKKSLQHFLKKLNLVKLSVYILTCQLLNFKMLLKM